MNRYLDPAAKTYTGLREAVLSLTPGDTLLLREGTYTDPWPDVPSGKSWDKPVTIAAAPGSEMTLSASRPNEPARAMKIATRAESIRRAATMTRSSIAPPARRTSSCAMPRASLRRKR